MTHCLAPDTVTYLSMSYYLQNVASEQNKFYINVNGVFKNKSRLRFRNKICLGGNYTLLVLWQSIFTGMDKEVDSGRNYKGRLQGIKIPVLLRTQCILKSPEYLYHKT